MPSVHDVREVMYRVHVLLRMAGTENCPESLRLGVERVVADLDALWALNPKQPDDTLTFETEWPAVAAEVKRLWHRARLWLVREERPVLQFPVGTWTGPERV
ncbi:protein of unknown function [Candidatus Hydrogenisulfobacillus filiaventi]|uniref:Uncharacterized protein n=1 Tax=Candidatus Hydrogenisulfobacillus filiaventi TaxID=2707344 RepID=A0A6F8ZGZ8_9FIRM|nr:hypothetical protein [Bacillota bacterium]CAB1129034.1 protein of unknown function [Candidatus Hydrogenisulfobacillus filiaventi]